jgi:hypothetical protein
MANVKDLKKQVKIQAQGWHIKNYAPNHVKYSVEI